MPSKWDIAEGALRVLAASVPMKQRAAKTLQYAVETMPDGPFAIRSLQMPTQCAQTLQAHAARLGLCVVEGSGPLGSPVFVFSPDSFMAMLRDVLPQLDVGEDDPVFEKLSQAVKTYYRK